jgi:hypothetical protein
MRRKENMSIFSNILGTPKEKRMQFFFRDDARATFRKLDIMDASVVEKDNNNKEIKGWADYYKMLFYFRGYRGIPAGALSLAFDRSPILDNWDILNDEEKLPKNTAMDHPHLQNIAKSRMYKIDTTAKGGIYANKVIIFCGAGTLIEILGMLFLKAYGGG